jgi:hypothetical protein
LRIIEPQLAEAARLHKQTGKAARVFTAFDYRTRASWSRARPVVAKAEQLEEALVQTERDLRGAAIILDPAVGQHCERQEEGLWHLSLEPVAEDEAQELAPALLQVQSLRSLRKSL